MKHGKHRRTSPPAHGSPVDGASSTDARAKAFATFRGIPIHTVPFDLSPGAVNTIDPGVVADQLKPRSDMVTYVSLAFMSNHLLDVMIKPKPSIPHAGITAGEIEGRRLWWVTANGDLSSLAHKYLWKPGEVETGDVDETVSWRFPGPIKGGIYAFKTKDEMAILLIM